ncbi:hypothetical protein JJJ17_14965 [Paracoccus caeni]|uniref:Peptidase inhibitor I78 family protein n=1 Tax=Paracoccus caeni TaxID=657651 RepID=A0A934VVR3_9RHOB|nr:I78 family peptidase inhibitor [Paracoccus caeni]MBK4217231.1 hypothetical protein [Paracoccus caeni]
MSRLSLLLAPALLSTLAACATTSEGPTVMARQCDLEKHQTLVGMNIGEVNFPAVLPRRVISTGDAYTRDFRPNRLNLFVDEKGWIAKVTCG